jgi:anti-sigma factor RsiW
VTSDEAEERFSAAFDGLLSDEERVAFEAALAGDEPLRREYEEFAALLRETQRLALDEDEAEVPDLLPSVQERIRVRSGNRFFRDRFSRQGPRQTVLPIVLAAAMLVAVVVSWFVLNYADIDEPTPETTQTP